MGFEFTTVDDVSTLHPNIISFVPRYVQNRKDDYEGLVASIENEDFEAIRDYCHKVVGTARSYHFFRLEEITIELQKLGREKDIHKIRNLMPDYDVYIKSLFKEYLADPVSLKK